MEQPGVRSVPLKGNSAIQHHYNRVGLALAVFSALCFFLALWGVNGFFTARTVRSIGLLFHAETISWGAGWLVHVVVSLIEHHLWRLREALGNAPRFVAIGVYCLIIIVGTLDVLTSAFAFLALFASIGLSPTDPTIRFVSTLLSEVIAILPEPVIVWLSVALYRVVKD